MVNVLTIAEIQSQFEGEWVLIVNPNVDEQLEVQSGEVLFLSRNRDEVYREAVAQRPERFAVLFTGELPHDTAIVL